MADDIEAQAGGGDADQEAMMAEWEAMADDDGSGGGDGGGETAVGSTRVLDQNEIDSLLGVDGSALDDGDKSGIQAILNSALVSYERLPMLEVVFDRLVRMMSTSLRNFTSDNVEVSLDNISSARFGDYLNSIPLPAMLAVFKAEEWDNFGLMTVDSALIYSIVDVLLGGRRGTAAMRIEGRPYTTIERNLVERMVHVVLGDLSAAFDPLSPTTFRFERLETNPRFATIARAANATVVVTLRVDMEDRGGRIELLIPYATLEPVRELLLQMFMGEKFGRDSIWESHLTAELWRTEVPLTAVLDQVELPLGDVLSWVPGSRLEPVRELLLQMFMGEKFGRDSIWESHLTAELWRTEVPLTAVLDQVELPLGDVLSWVPGSRLELNNSTKSPIEMRCGDVPLFTGHMGRKSNHIAVRIAGDVVRYEDDGPS